MFTNRLRIFYSLLILSILSACTTEQQRLSAIIDKTLDLSTPLPTYTIQSTYTPESTYTPQSTYTPNPTHTTLFATKVVIEYILVTPDPSNERTIIAIERTTIANKTQIAKLTPSLDPRTMTIEKSGVYRVGVDILPGKWKLVNPPKLSGYSDCYWAKYDPNGKIITDWYGDGAGKILIIEPTVWKIEFDNCGKIEYLGQ